MPGDVFGSPCPYCSWSGPFEPALSRAAVEALETGQVLTLPDLRFDLRAEEGRLLLEDVPVAGRRKSLSFRSGNRPTERMQPSIPTFWPACCGVSPPMPARLLAACAAIALREQTTPWPDQLPPHRDRWTELFAPAG